MTGNQAAQQLRLLEVPIVGLMPLSVDEANDLLVVWGHRLGRCERPFRQEAYALELYGLPIAVAISASIVSDTVAGYKRQEVVELARLWREVLAPRWAGWPVRAAISYSKNADVRGDIYRFDGWTKVRDDCGSSGGGAWSRKRYASEAAHGRKTLWLWRYEQ